MAVGRHLKFYSNIVSFRSLKNTPRMRSLKSELAKLTPPRERERTVRGERERPRARARERACRHGGARCATTHESYAVQVACRMPHAACLRYTVHVYMLLQYACSMQPDVPAGPNATRRDCLPF